MPSTYLLVGLVDISFGELLKTTLKWALGSFVIFMVAALLTGAIPLLGR